MRRFFLLLTVLSLLLGQTCFAKTKGTPNIAPQSGYKGTLPDISKDFEYKKKTTEVSVPIRTEENAKVEEFLPEPRQEKMYIDIIKKKDLTSNYVNDLNDMILLLEKLKRTIINGSETQLFNAQVSAYIDNCIFLEQKYGGKPEQGSASYQKAMELSNVAYRAATLRREATCYAKYLSASEEGEVYTKENINKELRTLLNAINETLPILKETH